MISTPPDSAQFLKAKIRIGSCKVGSTDYKHNQAIFHKDDIPFHVRQRKQEVVEWNRRKTLDEPRIWNKSVATENPIMEHRKMENFVHDRSKAYVYNFRSESLDPLKQADTIDRPTKFHFSRTNQHTAREIIETVDSDPFKSNSLKRTEELPINVKLSEKAKWNDTTSVDHNAKAHSLRKLTEKSRSWTGKVNNELAKLNYTSPIEMETNFLEAVRNKKRNHTFVPTAVLEHVKPYDGLVAVEVRNKNAVEPTNAFRTHAHSGIWEFNPIEKRHMWSDTGSYEKESRGDMTKVYNPDKYNYAPNLI